VRCAESFAQLTRLGAVCDVFSQLTRLLSQDLHGALPFQGKRPQDASVALCAPTQRQQHHLEGMMPQPLQMVVPAAYQAFAMPDKAALVDVQGSFPSCVCASPVRASPSFPAAGPSCRCAVALLCYRVPLKIYGYHITTLIISCLFLF
jgi:hypothetical protein